MNYIGIDGKVHDNRYLIHFNPYHDALGRFASGSGGGRTVTGPRGTKVSVNDPRYIELKKAEAKAYKTGENLVSTRKRKEKLQQKDSRYKTKAAKYNRKANKVKRMAANPLIGRTDFREAANYASLRYEGKGLKYTEKAAKANKKITDLTKKEKDLGRKFTQQEEYAEKLFNDIFLPGAPKGYH